jgi:hypothetical protein
MRQAVSRGAYGVEYLAALLAPPSPPPISPLPPTIILPGVPVQQEVDRDLALYDAAVAYAGNGASW